MLHMYDTITKENILYIVEGFVFEQGPIEYIQ